ncbi:MAG: ribosome maturation factor RimM [Burkholderiales bacterium]|nr:ribosome maturation factor RimM [Burkholderiales bacterium]
MEDVVVMARVAGAFGIKGWLKLHTFTQSPDSLDAYASSLLRGSKGWEEFELEDFAVNVKGVVAKLKGCDDRTAAENLAKRDIGIPRNALEEAAEGEVFWFDLIGCDVVNTVGEKFGKVETLLETGANDVLVVKLGTEEILIPYVDEVILKVDREAKLITVNWTQDFQ